ncbi:MAG: DUF748 domain-containing protein [Pseudobacteriovorax sp.]|nr:DUF748 domain-containing protein [Pseudobacteriovorax sp.]
MILANMVRLPLLVKIFLALAFLTALLLLSLPFFIKQTAISMVAKHSPWELSIDSLDLQYFSAGVIIEGIGLQLDKKNELTLQRIELDIDGLSLFSGQIDIENFGISGFASTAKVAKDSLSVAGVDTKTLQPKSDGKEAAVTSEVASNEAQSPMAFSLKNKAIIEDTNFAIDLYGKTYDIQLKALEVGPLASLESPIPFLLDLSLGQLFLKLTGVCKLSSSYTSCQIDHSLEVGDLSELNHLIGEVGHQSFKLAGQIDKFIGSVEYEATDISRIKGTFELSATKVAYKEETKDKNELAFDSLSLVSGYDLSLGKTNEMTALLVSPDSMALDGFTFAKADAKVVDFATWRLKGLKVNRSGFDTKLTLDSLKVDGILLADPNEAAKQIKAGDKKFNLLFAETKANQRENGNLDVKTKLGQFGKLDLDVNVNKDDQKNLELTLDAIDLTDLSGLFVQQMGYRIERGQLNSKAKAFIEKNGDIKGDLEMELAQLNLDSESQSGDAFKGKMGLPLGTSMSMIKDDNGNIELAFPLTGNTNSPSFGVSGLLKGTLGSLVTDQIAGALGNALIKSYLPLLASSLPVSPTLAYSLVKKGYDFATKLRFEPIVFHPLSDKPTSSSMEQLNKIADVMTEKPGVRLNFCSAGNINETTQWQRSNPDQKLPSTVADAVIEDGKLSNERAIALAQQRIKTVAVFLIDQKKIAASRVITCSPKVDSQSEEPVSVTVSI